MLSLFTKFRCHCPIDNYCLDSLDKKIGWGIGYHFFKTIFEVTSQILYFFPDQNLVFMALKTIGMILWFQRKNRFVKGPNIALDMD